MRRGTRFNLKIIIELAGGYALHLSLIYKPQPAAVVLGLNSTTTEIAQG